MDRHSSGTTSYVKLVQIENIHDAEHLERSEHIAKLNLSAIDKLAQICRKGVEEGAFRSDVTPLQLHWLINSSCVFNIANRATFSHLYGGELFTDEGQATLKELISSAVLAAVRC